MFVAFSLCNVRCVLRRLLFVVACVLLVRCCVNCLFAVCCLLFVICCSLVAVVRRVLCGVCCLVIAVR